MRVPTLLAAALALGLAAPAFAQGPGGDEATQPSDPAQLKAIDDGYRGRCEPNAPKELCSCVIAVAGANLVDAAERQVFYDFMMGDLDKAKTARGMFAPQKNMRFNLSLQKADVMLGEQCDKLKPQPKEEPQGQPAPQGDGPQGGQKLP